MSVRSRKLVCGALREHELLKTVLPYYARMILDLDVKIGKYPNFSSDEEDPEFVEETLSMDEQNISWILRTPCVLSILLRLCVIDEWLLTEFLIEAASMSLHDAVVALLQYWPSRVPCRVAFKHARHRRWRRHSATMDDEKIIALVFVCSGYSLHQTIATHFTRPPSSEGNDRWFAATFERALAHDRLESAALHIQRKRLTTVCLALASLCLPVLLTTMILEEAFGLPGVNFRMFHLWKIAAAVRRAHGHLYQE